MELEHRAEHEAPDRVGEALPRPDPAVLRHLLGAQVLQRDRVDVGTERHHGSGQQEPRRRDRPQVPRRSATTRTPAASTNPICSEVRRPSTLSDTWPQIGFNTIRATAITAITTPISLSRQALAVQVQRQEREERGDHESRREEQPPDRGVGSDLRAGRADHGHGSIPGINAQRVVAIDRREHVVRPGPSPRSSTGPAAEGPRSSTRTTRRPSPGTGSGSRRPPASGGNSSVPNSMRVGCRSRGRVPPRPATQLGDARRDVGVQVGVGGRACAPTHARSSAAPATCAADERGPRMARPPAVRTPPAASSNRREPRTVAEPPLGMLAAAPRAARSARPSVRRTPADRRVWISHRQPRVAGRLPHRCEAARRRARADRRRRRARCSPRSFQTLRPRAPASAARRTWAASRSPNPASAVTPPVELRERREPARMRTVVAVEIGPQLIAPSAVEVHDRGDVGRSISSSSAAHVGRAQSRGEPPPQVVVGIDRGEPRGTRCRGPAPPRAGIGAAEAPGGPRSRSHGHHGDTGLAELGRCSAIDARRP